MTPNPEPARDEPMNDQDCEELYRILTGGSSKQTMPFDILKVLLAIHEILGGKMKENPVVVARRVMAEIRRLESALATETERRERAEADNAALEDLINKIPQRYDEDDLELCRWCGKFCECEENCPTQQYREIEHPGRSLLAELTRRRKRVTKSEALNKVVACAFCRKVFEQDDPELSTKMANHIFDCEKHPMRKLAEEIALLRAAEDVAAPELEKLRAVRDKAKAIFNIETPWIDQLKIKRQEALDELKAALDAADRGKERKEAQHGDK